ncbi:MAG: hypothetical protein IJ629_05830 [Clostridia bacterium]|nr:hypothetical protein [Clostridia bacterium]
MKYFGLKGIDAVVVDFSTRTAYSVNGIKDSNDNTKIYYTPSEWGSNTVIKKGTAEIAKPVVIATKISNIDNVYDVNLTFNTKLETEIREVYIADASTNVYKAVDSFRDITQASDTGTKIRVTVVIDQTTEKTYNFKLIDSAKNEPYIASLSSF